jgi:predicted dehydrogenase/threonine dehydrogenase-like Zn-dependent dehydrogenase
VKQVLVKQGQIVVEDIPLPLIESGTVLVQVEYSSISTGTELSGIKTSGVPLWKRALQNPARVKSIMQMVTAQGVGATRGFVANRLAASTAGKPTGYSAAGRILEVGERIEDLVPGDRVACAGAQYAFHAEVIRVPRNLVVHVPETLETSVASTVTLGAIALQGIRRAQPTLGETFVVIGLGILGQLTAQMLQANGCRVIGIDLSKVRIQLARQLGMDVGIHPNDDNDIDQVARLTDGIGADGVIIAAATPSNVVISTAFRMCRKKGRVVLVGDVGLHLNRADFYEKELDFFISTSYGPGRYDRRYEEEGLDYPTSHVRWTENRNMAEYLRLLAEHKLEIKSLINTTYVIDEAATAYAVLESGENRPLIVLLSYPQKAHTRQEYVVRNPAARSAGQGKIRVAVVGVGEFARAVHLPNLKALTDQFYLQAVVNRSGHEAVVVAQQFGAARSSTDYSNVLEDPVIDAVIIATRHNLHAQMALEALRAGKHVLVEKPLALTQAELDSIRQFYDDATNGAHVPVLLTGFNRRFSVYAHRIHELISERSNPMMINYRMNAGYMPLDHWVHGEEGGGRNRGEACHIYDLFTYFADSRLVHVETQPIAPSTEYYSPRDNFITIMKFEDGSVATLMYTSLGSTDHPKEQMEIFVDGKVIILDDYRQLTITGAKGKAIKTQVSDKGHRAELADFARAIQNGGKWPIPLWQQIQATAIALQVEGQLGSSVQPPLP